MTDELKIKAGVVAGLMALTVLISHATATDTDRKVFNETAPKTYRMLNPDYLESGGTGFEVKGASGSEYLMTNAHVCNMTERSYVIAERDGNVQRATIIAVSTRADLCLLTPIKGQDGLTLARNAPMGEKVFITGHPYLQPVTLTDGFINYKGFAAISYCRTFNPNQAEFFILPRGEIEGLYDCIKMLNAYYTNANSAPGNSGSAVVNESRELVGVLFAGNGHGISLVVPLEDVREFLANY